MSNSETRLVEGVFEWPTAPYEHRHGPAGYADYRSFKPWLRDEFSFRCIYCLTRERWFPNGYEGFAVEHIVPRTIAPERVTEYENLLDACCSCNRNRRDIELPVNPLQESFGRHLEISENGTINWRTDEGRSLVRICNLNRPLLAQFRRRLRTLLSHLASRTDVRSRQLLTELMGFPDDLPDLTSKRPPAGNSRPAGIENSAFALRKRGELPDIY